MFLLCQFKTETTLTEYSLSTLYFKYAVYRTTKEANLHYKFTRACRECKVPKPHSREW